ncbi:cell adhesion molecule-related/down-regulated by oncogenes [Triplophysa rosa]|uniref:Cell adhesion molecule-related/down-regulated by oncogenes-like n=1 Tax=Triplophysa rosa TaxID=992332 RepID=A0A9W7TTP8_TRIRA|nr:cell adhesion molecule-related/down-regulated by oncogenes [Triplophysa rosa]KAI7802416.1 cell adhesion molecule-related/down-regulated by oncogenes-like [Triplophysa rosa]
MEDSGLRLLSAVLCVCHILLFNCPSVLCLSFRVEPLSVVQKQGGAVQLRCTARPATARLSWLFQGRPIDPVLQNSVEITPGSLSLPSLQPALTGSYQCVAQSETGSIISRHARVLIAGIEEFAETHRRLVMVKKGDPAVIECTLPHSNPPALPRYRIRGKWLEQSSDEYLILPSGNLQINSVSVEHQGMYKCGASNPLSRETQAEAHGTKLVVKDSEGPSPVGIVYPITSQNLTVEQSESVTLECVISGSPSSKVKWTKDGSELMLSSKRMLLHSNLVLNDIHLSDRGHYCCSVLTDHGDVVSVNYTVNVLENVSILRGLSDQAVTEGSSVRFTCTSSGYPSPNIIWLLNSTPLSSSPRLRISGSSLRIPSVTAQDLGIFQCLLDNGISSAQSAGRLSLQLGENSKPTILFPPESGIYTEGDSVTLTCNASGQPLPVIRWHNSAGPIATHPALLLQPPQSAGDNPTHLAVSRPGSSTLYIQSVTAAHAGRYICEASNEVGSVQTEAFLTVGPKSSSMSEVASETQPSIHPIQSDEGDELFLKGLGDTIGSPSERISDKPTPEAPIIISPPQTHKPNMYDLEWRAGRDWGIPINAYFVKYRKVDDMGNVVGSWHTVRVPGSEKSLPLSDLEPSSLYEVLMVARSSAGEGQPAMLTFRTGKERSSPNKNPSKPPFVSLPEKVLETTNTYYGVVIHERVPEAPDRPTISTATESSVYVTWIPRANGGSPITAFRVEYRKQGRSGDWIVAADNISPLKLSVEVRNLEPGSTYRFRVIAMNNYGESPASTTSRPYQVSLSNPPVLNRPVSGPHISSTDAISDTQIMLRWTYTPSSNNNTPIQGFYIYYRPTDSDNDSDYKRDVVEGFRFWHMIGHLQPETSYDIKMQCFNDGGESEYSNVMICETRARQPPGVPSQRPITPPGMYPPETPSQPGGLLYLIVGCVLGVMVLILLAFIVMCLLRNRQQNSLHKYDPPSYLYQSAEMNGHVLEYSTLPGSSRVNGSVHTGCGHSAPMMPQSCHHLHHKLPNGVALLNGSGGLYPSGHPHTHDTSLPHNTMEYDRPHPHHHHNGGGMYTALPQNDSPDCMSCQNFCNNNRCYTKTNGTFSGGTLPLMHRVAARQPDGLEMMPLNPVLSRCQGRDSPQLNSTQQRDSVQEVEEGKAPPLSQNSPCQPVETKSSVELQRGGQREDPEGPVVCWQQLGLSDLDCKDKTAWISTGNLTGDFIQPTVQEI